MIEYHQPKQQQIESQWQTEKVPEITRSISDVCTRVNNLQIENQEINKQIDDTRQQIQSTTYHEDQRLIDGQKRFHDVEKYCATSKDEVRCYRLLLEDGVIDLRHFF